MTPAEVFLWIACALTAWALGRRKGYPWWGLVWGILLPVIGVIAMAVWPKTHARRVAEARKKIAIDAEARGGPAA